MSKAIKCDRCGKAESVGMSETFNGPFHEVLRPRDYPNQLDFCSLVRRPSTIEYFDAEQTEEVLGNIVLLVPLRR